MTTGRATRRGSTRTSRYDGRKQLSGDLIGVDGDDVRIDVKGLGETAIPFASIRNAQIADDRPADQGDRAALDGRRRRRRNRRHSKKKDRTEHGHRSPARRPAPFPPTRPS